MVQVTGFRWVCPIILQRLLRIPSSAGCCLDPGATVSDMRPNLEHPLNHCRLHDALWSVAWPEPTPLRVKLYGSHEDSHFRAGDIHLLPQNDDEEDGETEAALNWVMLVGWMGVFTERPYFVDKDKDVDNIPERTGIGNLSISYLTKNRTSSTDAFITEAST